MNDRYDHEEAGADGYWTDPSDDAYFDDYAAELNASDPYGRDPYWEEDRHGRQSRTRYPADPYARREAALRRRNILFSLVVALLVTTAAGFVASMLWYLTVLCVILLIAYVGLMAWAATRGSITLGSSSSSPRRDSERHIARAVVSHHGTGEAARWGDDGDGQDDRYDVRADQADDGWWDQPRRAAAR
jgi:hypothetical protein